MGQGTGRASFPRCLLVLLAVTAGTGTLAAALLPDVVALGRMIRSGALGAEPFDVALVQVCELAVTLCAAWLWLASAVVAVDAARGRSCGRRCVPRAVRRVVLAACGAALLGGLGAPAHAGGQGATSPLEGLPLPDRATTTMRLGQAIGRPASTHRVRTERPPELVVVRPGDTLWELARGDLPPGAGDRAVAARVLAIHDANRAVIGPDPDLILPDQRLRMPRP